MNKIVLQFGLLVFFFSIIFFTQRGLAIEKVLLNSFAIFILVTTMLSLIVIGLIKAINNNSLSKLGDLSDNLAEIKIMSNAILWASYKEKPSPELKKQIVLTYVNLVHYVIHRTNLIQSALLDRRDYFQFGIEGLSEAIDRFDPDYGTKFETYAIQRIRGKIYDELRKYSDKFEPVLEPDATTMFPTSTLSVNQSVGEDDGMQLYEMLPSDAEKPDFILEKKDLKQRLLDMIKELNERERTILSLYYYEDLNYKEIAQVLSITVSRVSQIHSRILNSLKLRLAEYNA